MRANPSVLALALTGWVAACSGTPRRAREPDPEPPPVASMDAGVDAPSGPVIYEDTEAPDGSPCAGPSECSADAMCRGPRGCMTDWACGAPLSCGEDRIAYCDCENVTFYALSGCPGRPYAHVGGCEVEALAELEFGLPRGDEPITTADRICSSSADCRRGEVCYGPSGCGTTWRCERVRGCGGPRETFCACDGTTFTASASCPGQSYLRRGACEGVVASAEVDAGVRRDAGTVVASGRPDAGVPIVSSRPDAGVVIAAAAPDAGARWTSTVTADGAHTCRTNRDCRRPEVCMGTGGCGETWTCQRPPEACMADTQYFCDCTGRSFTASMNCPGRLYAHRGSCAIDEYIELSGGATH